MTEGSEVQKPATGAEGEIKRVRPPFFPTLKESLQYMRQAADVEGKRLRKEDFISTVSLPLSLVLLIVTCLFPVSSVLKASLFILPLLAFAYYVGVRIGIVRTMTTRQAYIVWHVIMGTVLFGATLTLMIISLREALHQ